MGQATFFSSSLFILCACSVLSQNVQSFIINIPRVATELKGQQYLGKGKGYTSQKYLCNVQLIYCSFSSKYLLFYIVHKPCPDM